MRKSFREIKRDSVCLGDSIFVKIELQKKPIETKSGDSVDLVVPVKVDMMVLNDDMPSKSEYDLETMLKNGVNPEQINVHGLIVDENGGFDSISAFNRLQEQIDKFNPSQEVESIVEPKE